MKNSTEFDQSPKKDWKYCSRPHYIDTGKPAHPGKCDGKKILKTNES